MKLLLRILFLDGQTKEVTCSASDLVKFEDKFNLSVAKLEDDLRISHLLFLAWASETRTKATTLGFDAWVETVDNIGPSEADPK